MSNATCFTKHAPFEGPSLIQNGELKFQAHHVGWIIAFVFTMVATIASFWLISKHLMWYTNKRQQRYIIRLLLMVPIYATVSLASYIFWNHAIPITLARDSYEALVLYSFFYLLLQYLSPTSEGQKEVFRKVVLKKWVFPLGFVKYRPEDGLYFLQLMKWGVLQYCVVRPTTTLAAVILDTVGLYCEDSWGPGWGHVYITIIVSVSVTVAMYCLIQLYMPVAEQLAPHKPVLKLVSVKAVVFLTFWQATGLSVLTIFGVVKDTKYMTAEDINTGIAAILETFEMMCFAFLHVRAFSYHPYREGKKLSDRTPRLRSFGHALDFRDMWREIWEGSVYMGKTMRGVDAEEEVRKRIHFERVMGRERGLNAVKGPKQDWAVDVEPWEDDRLLEHGRRQDRRELYLSDPGNRFGGVFEDEVERELRQRDKEYHLGVDMDLEEPVQGHTRGQNSWWRGIYNRVSQGGHERASEDRLSPVPQRAEHARQSRKHRRRDLQFPSLDSPPPPPAVMYEYAASGEGTSSVRLSHSHQRTGNAFGTQGGDEVRIGHHYGQQHKSNNAGARIPSKEPPPKDQRADYASPIAAPRPMYESQVSHIESLVSRLSMAPETTGPTPHHKGGHLAVVVRSDSLLARVFPNSTPNTVDGHVSSEARSNPTSSQDTLSTAPMFPPAMSSSTVDLSSPIRGRRAEPFSTPMLSTPGGFRSNAHTPLTPPKSGSRDAKAPPLARRGHSRPDIVLPAPLSTAHNLVDSPRQGYSPTQNARNPSPHNRPTSPSNLPSPSLPHATRHDTPPSPLRSDGHHRDRRHSAQVERPLARKHRATKRNSVPAEHLEALPVRETRPSRGQAMVDRYPVMVISDEDDGMRITSHSTRMPDSPIGSGSATHLTTPPTSPPRKLRHPGEDISKGRRPWS